MALARKPLELGQDADIPSLRAYYHSLHENDREEVIDLLGSMPEPDAARELIQLFHECQWRESRLRIIRALSRHPHQRSLEFLFQLARDVNDLPLAEAAIWSLGQTHHVLAARFLVHTYPATGELLRPAYVGALGHLPDRTLAAELVRELREAIRGDKAALLRNLVLTLGELKVREALPDLEKLALESPSRPIALSALVSFGKIARDARFLDKCEARFRDDLFEYQLFTSVRNQVQFRSQWKLEDYLSKLFESASFHRSLPFELTGFAPEDVKEGLKLFASDPRHFDRLCLALSRIDFPGVARWYPELFDFKKLTDEQAAKVLESMSAHLSDEMAGPIRELGGRGEPVFSRWLEAMSMALPGADTEFAALIASETYRALDDAGRIQVINHLVNYGLSVQAVPARLQKVGRILEGLLESEGSPTIVARALRAMGDLGIVSSKAFGLIKKRIGEPALTGSCLSYLEHCPEKNSQAILLEWVGRKTKGHEALLLRALNAQPSLPDSEDAVDAFVAANLGSAAAPEARLEALAFVARHPRKKHLHAVIDCLKGDRRIRLGAIIALRSLGDEAAADALAPFLSSESQATDESLTGRALDTLTALPGLRAKRLVIDFFKDHAEDEDVCDKVIRCLGAPEGSSEYFTAAIDGVLRKHPQHPQLDGLLSLRERIASRRASPGAGAPRGADIVAVDRELAKKIPGYEQLDEGVRSALRSAETPYLHPEMFDQSVDKASSVLEYCKAADILLEKELGRRLLFPRLESSLHEFQNAVHAASLNESFPSADAVIRHLGLEKHFNSQSLPLHKMVTIAQSILSGKILNDRFKTLDGLRAWAIILLLFGRKSGNGYLKPLVPIKNVTDDELIKISRRLMNLQDARNPAAHRQTFLEFVGVDEVRNEVCQLLNHFQRMF